MPSTVTHTYFTLDVYQKLPISMREIVMDQKDMLKVFGQSMDVLFFYNITNFHHGKRVRQFGHYFHEHQTQEFFINLINYIKYNHYGNTSSVMAFLYGILTHYVLDSTLHPYIIYKTGIYDPKDKSTYIYQQKHEHMETFIDNYMLFQREGKKPYHIRSDKFCFQLRKLGDPLKEVIDYSFKETFDINHMSRFYEKAIYQMRFFYRYFRNDRTGLKRLGYLLIDKVTPKNTYRFEVISYHIKPKDKWNYLNKEKKAWSHPINRNEIHHESYVELYIIALHRAVDLIKQVTRYILTDDKISLKKLFPDISYVTGKKYDQKRKMHYFEKKYP